MLFCFQIDSVALKESMRNMTENFYAAIFGYDEVILITQLAPYVYVTKLTRQGSVFGFLCF